MFDPGPLERSEELKRNQAGYVYGPSLIGNTSYFPTGTLGNELVAKDLAMWEQDAVYIQKAIAEDAPLAREALANAGGLQNLSSYELLYKNQWKNSNPTGVVPGGLTNYTQDLFFSMERLSINPSSVKRLHPERDELPFDVEKSIVLGLSGKSLVDLHAAGRLFLVDHSYQAKYPTVEGRYTAACSAYFYIHPVTQDFLPLAIKTNAGSDLVYTPLDDENDWLLAKIMFNSNDLFYAQVLHLGFSHAVAEIVHEAALRTISERHPVRAFLDHLMLQAYAIRPEGEKLLFNPGGAFDQSFSLNSVAVREFLGEFYPKVAGLFRANFLRRFLTDRGLLDCSYGPALAHFPFAQDALAIVSSIRLLATEFVNSYYPSEDLLGQDIELQSWILEASHNAHVLDFPASPLVSKDILISILTQVAYLTGVNHHALNGNTPSAASAVLPFHPAAIYRPPPKVKGVKDLLPYLPNFNASIAQVTLLLAFNRPKLSNSERDLANMFSSPVFLNSGAAAIVKAAQHFRDQMLRISDGIQAREFDKNGLAQGMPFIWRGLDPRNIPFFLTV
ncbi:hypothetical protein MMC22_000317 [Lobaria immixta]|nr:hypothetical protein [Lobaria immixta]